MKCVGPHISAFYNIMDTHLGLFSCLKQNSSFDFRLEQATADTNDTVAISDINDTQCGFDKFRVRRCFAAEVA